MAESLSDVQIREITQQIIEDYQSESEVFAEYQLPEYEVLDDFSTEEGLAKYITFATSINLNRETTGEGGVWKKCKRLYDSDRYDWVFEPERVAEMNGIDLYEEVFNQIGLGGSAAGIWCGVGESLHEDVDGDVHALIEQADANAVALKSHLKQQEYQSLRREKVGHLWLRLIDEEVQSLAEIEEIAIPVDRHIITVTEFLTGQEYSRDSDEDLAEVRDIWHRICDDEPYYPVQVDKPLWLIGKHWDSIGQAYVTDTLEEMS